MLDTSDSIQFRETEEDDRDPIADIDNGIGLIWDIDTANVAGDQTNTGDSLWDIDTAGTTDQFELIL